MSDEGDRFERPRAVPWRSDDPSDLRLASNVKPSSGASPRSRKPYQLVVVGGGSAGLVTAAAAAGLGARVALVEKRGLGGDCLLTGCVPSKALLAAAKRVHAVRSAGELGVFIDGTVRVDFRAVMTRMRTVRAELSPMDSVKRFEAMGVDVFPGHGRFVGPDAMEVGDHTLRFGAAVLATGARLVWPDIPGLDEIDVLTTSSVFNLTRLPSSLLVLGAGPVGCELVQAFARFGSRTTLVEAGPRPLPAASDDAAAALMDSLRKDGVQVETNTTVERVASCASGVRVWLSGHDSPVEVSALLLATGRTPAVEGLGLDRAGVQVDGERGIRVDAHLQTTNPRIWAAGDCVMGEQFTHVADASARVVVQNALFPKRRSASAFVVPSCVYTDPEVARVGWSPSVLEARNIPHETLMVRFADVDRARLDGADQGWARVWVRAGTDRLLGGEVVGEGAGDIIGALGLAMTQDVGLGQLSATIFPYPTRMEVLRKLGDAWRRQRLTPHARAALSLWFRWKN